MSYQLHKEKISISNNKYFFIKYKAKNNFLNY